MRTLLLISSISISVFFFIKTMFFVIFGVNIGTLYSSFMIIIALFVYIFFILNILIQKIVKKTTALLVFIILLVTIFALINFDYTYVRSTYIYFFVWAVPAALAGIILSNNKKEHIIKFFRIYLWLSNIILALLGFYYGYNFNDSSLNILTSYQQLSYMAAFNFGLGLYYFNSISTYKFRALEIIFLINNLLICFASGGRGGAVLLIGYIVLYIVLNIRALKIANTVILFSILIFAISVSFEDLIGERTFSYITEEGIDFQESSGRDLIYLNAVQHIEEKPILGYGLFGYYKIIGGVPHNIFLEILLIAGVLGLLVSILVFFYLFILLFKKLKNNNIDVLLVYLLLYPLVMLLFSGNFLNTSELWFVVFYILSVEWVDTNAKIH